MIKSILLKLIDMVKRYGFYSTILIIYYKLMQNKRNKKSIKLLHLTYDDIAVQKATKFKTKTLFSIITPIYNTNTHHLQQMLESCINQTYANWELILTDGSSLEEPGIICKAYAQNDKRIKYIKLEKNHGISGNTNQAIKLATGDYILLLDHDDILLASALYEAMLVIEKQSPDFIYSDMVSFIGNTNNLFHFHHKPDFSIYTLRSLNYICHLALYKRSLAKNIGEFKSEYDSAQDYDMFLRIAEKAKSIYHIRKILYFWRAHNNSMSFNINSKPETLNAAINVISDHYKRLKIKATVLNSSIPTTFKTLFHYKKNASVAIILPITEECDIDNIVNQILKKTTYDNYEIVVATSHKFIQIKENPLVKIYYLATDNLPILINYAIKHTTAEQLLIMSNDIKLTTPTYIEEMLNYSMRDDIGAVMVKMLDKHDKLYSAGIGLDNNKGIVYYHAGIKKKFLRFIRILTYAHNISAVSQYFFMISRKKLDSCNGFDERYSTNYFSIDLSLKLLENGYNNIFTPYVVVYFTGNEKHDNNDFLLFQTIWQKRFKRADPFYNQLTD